MTSGPWLNSFEIDGDPNGYISLDQMGRKEFRLNSTITYIGAETGLEGMLSDDALAAIRTVTPEKLPTTDLVSVPTVLRWFVGRYGVHTPAALIHDWLIPQPSTPEIPGMTNEYADRYWRFMLDDLGVRLIRRWLMWAATAARTRWQRDRTGKLLLSVWLLASLAGIAAFVFGLIKGNASVIILAALAPLVFAPLWGRQYGAGIVAAYSAPWIVPPTVFAAGGYVVYLVGEWIISGLWPSRSGSQPFRYEDF
ncbi:MAG: DUF1353 domain-containing protein [Actinomycetota bacterium]